MEGKNPVSYILVSPTIGSGGGGEFMIHLHEHLRIKEAVPERKGSIATSILNCTSQNVTQTSKQTNKQQITEQALL